MTGAASTQVLNPAQLKYERAQRALDHFRRVQPNLEAFARIFTRDKNMTVVPSATSSMTDGKRIFLRVDIGMGDEHRHDRENCQKRNAREQLVCEACLVREDMLVALFHEIAHVAYDSFAAMSDLDKERAVEEAVAEAGRYGIKGKRLERIRESMENEPPRSYGEAAARISPYLHPLINGLEDARINVRTMQARPGMKAMFQARATRIFEEGIEMPDGSMAHWREQPGNAQMSVALSQFAQDHYDPDWFSPEVAEALEDPELQKLAKQTVEVGGPGEVYKLAFPILENLRGKGFFRTDDEPPEDEEEDEEDEPLSNEDAPNESDDADREDTGGDDDEEGESDSEPEVSENDDASDGDQEADDDGDAGDSDGDEADSDDEHGTGASGDGEGDTDSNESDDDDCAPGGEEEETSDSDNGSGVGAGDQEPTDGDEEQDDSGAAGDGDEEADDDTDGEEGDHPGDEEADEQDPDQLAGTGSKENDAEGDEAPDRTADDEEAAGDDEGSDQHRAEGEPDDLNVALGALCQHQHEDHAADDADDPPPDDDEQVVEVAIVQGRDFDEPSHHVYETKVYETGRALNIERVRALQSHLGTLPVPEAVMMRSLGKMRVAFSENRKGRTDKNRRSGKINAKALGRRIPIEDDRVFQKRRLPGKRDYFVVIGIDASASTSRGSRIQNIKTAAMAQAELLHRLGVPFEVWAHSCDGNGIDNPNHFGPWLETQVYKIKSSEQRWDGAAKDRLESIVPWQANLDGHTMEFYRKRLDQSNATDKVLMYYTDGEMPYVNYDEELHILKRELRECERRGYVVVGVAFQTDSPKGHGLPTVRIDTGDDIPAVVEELRKRLAG